MKSSIEFGSRRIDFRLEYSVRKSLGITVTPEMEVIVKAPTATPIELVRRKLKAKAPWIIKQQNHFLAYHPKSPKRKYISGETHLYMGRQYRLLVQISKEESVKLIGGFIIVSTLDKSKAKALVEQWYRQHAHRKLHEISTPLIERFRKYKVAPSAVVLRNMSTRWGSCTPKGKIILNPELIKAPRGCIEYVIIHELCHLVHYDHTKRFFELQAREMPDWEKWKGRLERALK